MYTLSSPCLLSSFHPYFPSLRLSPSLSFGTSVMADLMESNIEVEAEGGQEGGEEGERDTLELMTAPDKRYSEISEVPPSNGIVCMQ